MNHATDPDLLVPRTCTTSNQGDQPRSEIPLTDFRDMPAYVLLGDPGAGKTQSFKQEATASSGHYIRARDFATFDPSPELSGKTLFIDGLDEMRASGGDGRTPLDHVRRHLDRLGRPRFRLSCREADWYGDSDQTALREAAPEGTLGILHLDPLRDQDIMQLLGCKHGVSDPEGFVRHARRQGLAELLRNPQTLDLMAKAVGADTSWPDSRAATYDLACRQLAREINPEHRHARRDRAPTLDALLDAAGFLSAVQLLSGTAGFALDDDATDDQHILWPDLSPSRDLPLSDALASGLFQRDDSEQQRIPVHRSIAEYLGARHLARQIDTHGLPPGRIIALLSGSDGGILPDLRGLAAWLAAHCRDARTELIRRDPLGTVLYGDVRAYPTEDKCLVIEALRAEAERNAHFRFQDWAAAPFGALATPDMVPVFLEILAAPSRNEAGFAVLDCVLDALRHGPPPSDLAGAEALPHLDALLDAVVRNADYPPHIRKSGLKVLLRDLARNNARLLAIAHDVRADAVADDHDEILGLLLEALYPASIKTEDVLDYLHGERSQSYIGAYRMFWHYRLLENTPDDALPELVNEWVKRRVALIKSLSDSDLMHFGGTILARGLETHGDRISDAHLFDWLTAGFNEYDHPPLDQNRRERVAAWFAVRPERYKAIVLLSVHRLHASGELGHNLFGITSRLYGCEPPADMVPWYLKQVDLETDPTLKQHFFALAARELVRLGGNECLTLEALDELAPWVDAYPEFELILEPWTLRLLDDWRREDAIHTQALETDRQQRFQEWRAHVREHVDAVREGRAFPQIHHQLAQVYLHRSYDIKDETPHQRLATFLDDDALVEAACSGFVHCLDRDDLPSVTEIIALEVQGRTYLIREPCLIGMEARYRNDPVAALAMDNERLKMLLAFRLTAGIGDDPEWFTALLRDRPDLAEDVFVAHANRLLRKGREHLSALGSLTRNRDHPELARRVLIKLLPAFPLRAKNAQLSNILVPMLHAALRLLDRPTLAAIVSNRHSQASMSAAQRVYWLACGLMISPSDYEAPLAAHIGESEPLRAHLAGFLHDAENREGPSKALPPSSLALLVESLAPGSLPERALGGHWVTPAMHTADAVRAFIHLLGGDPSDDARRHLDQLLALPQLAEWHDRLRHAAYTQRIARRQADARQLSPTDVCRTLANRGPANAADLAALTEALLRDLADKIRNGPTNDYRQFWSDNAKGKPERPKHENECRNALLSDLTERLGRFGVDAVKEGYYAEDKRADIRVSCNGASGFNVPIEIKKDCHADLWRAMHEQLLARYTRDPGAEGFGIYVVFWFGGRGMPLLDAGKPRDAAELEEWLRSRLKAEERRYISVVVIDCALPGQINA